jgi:transketolase C-terminal domain/subunit
MNDHKHQWFFNKQDKENGIFEWMCGCGAATTNVGDGKIMPDGNVDVIVGGPVETLNAYGSDVQLIDNGSTVMVILTQGLKIENNGIDGVVVSRAFISKKKFIQQVSGIVTISDDTIV